MSPLILILLFGFLMSLIALSGALVLLLKPATLDRILLSLVGLSAGALLGGAFFHMLPAAGELMSDNFSIYLWTMAGFLFFLVLEQFLHWHHCHLA
ncbi:MAG: ZIP family metal transporter, partial [Deltaproteobacteria bacterium]|nr:ZIP family metal transporter [Deltaproteobacteria bacterium]